MTSIGAEVGQKMRSAIKAKLLELNCYVDDELPDYVMVMVANKRTKSQMKNDLQLFLSNKTTTFVDWLHIVLKKLKEVTVTNPEAYKKTMKRKAEDIPEVSVKKEKKKFDKKIKKNDEKNEDYRSLTDDLPINAHKLSEQRKIVVMKETNNRKERRVIDDDFDIPPLSEVNLSNEKELEEIEKKIKNVKNRLGLMVESDNESLEDYANIKSENEDNMPEKAVQRKVVVDETQENNQQPKHKRITFEHNDEENKRKSILERFGKRKLKENQEKSNENKRAKITLTDLRKEDEKPASSKKRESILNRLGVMSKVSVPQKELEEPEMVLKNREVASAVKIKPRIIQPDAPQANKKLLLKAVAEAQKSVTQTPTVGNNSKPDALFTKKYKEKMGQTKKIQERLAPENTEYIPKPIKKSATSITYTPTTKNEETEEEAEINPQFVITLDGVEKLKAPELKEKPSIKTRLEGRKTPSPIIFDKVTTSSKLQLDKIPDKLPIVPAPSSIKNKERCKYWPSCRQGDKCEFVHPTANCEMFPNCKFGDKCLFLHPTCKFGSSCTKRGCPYLHTKTNFTLKMTATPLQVCKYFPKCTNLNCAFYHPKPCKFGKFCKNQSECSFLHPTSKGNLIWRPK